VAKDCNAFERRTCVRKSCAADNNYSSASLKAHYANANSSEIWLWCVSASSSSIEMPFLIFKCLSSWTLLIRCCRLRISVFLQMSIVFINVEIERRYYKITSSVREAGWGSLMVCGICLNPCPISGSVAPVSKLASDSCWRDFGIKLTNTVSEVSRQTIRLTGDYTDCFCWDDRLFRGLNSFGDKNYFSASRPLVCTFGWTFSAFADCRLCIKVCLPNVGNTSFLVSLL